MRLKLPAVLSVRESLGRNTFQQIAERAASLEGTLANYSKGRLKGHLFQPTLARDPILIIPRTKNLPDGYPRIVLGKLTGDEGEVDLSTSTWCLWIGVEY